MIHIGLAIFPSKHTKTDYNHQIEFFLFEKMTTIYLMLMSTHWSYNPLEGIEMSLAVSLSRLPFGVPHTLMVLGLVGV